MAESTSTCRRMWVQTFHTDEPTSVLWEGWVYPKAQGAAGTPIYQIPLEGAALGRTWSARWYDAPPADDTTADRDMGRNARPVTDAS